MIRYGRSFGSDRILKNGSVPAKGGFTLFEMLVVLVIMSVSAAFVVPQLAGSLTKMNARTAAGKIAASLRYARSQAVSERIPYRSDFDIDKNRLTVRRYLSDGENTSSPMSDRFYNLPDGIRLELNQDSSHRTGEDLTFTILFFPTGGSSGGSMIVRDEKDRSFTLSVDLITGSVEVTE